MTLVLNCQPDSPSKNIQDIQASQNKQTKIIYYKCNCYDLKTNKHLFVAFNTENWKNGKLASRTVTYKDKTSKEKLAVKHLNYAKNSQAPDVIFTDLKITILNQQKYELQIKLKFHFERVTRMILKKAQNLLLMNLWSLMKDLMLLFKIIGKNY